MVSFIGSTKILALENVLLKVASFLTGNDRHQKSLRALFFV